MGIARAKSRKFFFGSWMMDFHMKLAFLWHLVTFTGLKSETAIPQTIPFWIMLLLKFSEVNFFTCLKHQRLFFLFVRFSYSITIAYKFFWCNMVRSKRLGGYFGAPADFNLCQLPTRSDVGHQFLKSQLDLKAESPKEKATNHSVAQMVGIRLLYCFDTNL